MCLFYLVPSETRKPCFTHILTHLPPEKFLKYTSPAVHSKGSTCDGPSTQCPRKNCFLICQVILSTTVEQMFSKLYWEWAGNVIKAQKQPEYDVFRAVFILRCSMPCAFLDKKAPPETSSPLEILGILVIILVPFITSLISA